MAGECALCGETGDYTCVICGNLVCAWHCSRDEEDDAIAWCDDCEAQSIAAHYAAEIASERSADDGG
jgi:hypothetical protein